MRFLLPPGWNSCAGLRELAVGVIVLSFGAAALGQEKPANPPAGLPDPSKLPALAFKEEKVGNYESPLLKVEGVVVGSSFTIDAAFAEKYENRPPSAPFKIVVPKSKNVLVFPGGKKTGFPEFVKVVLATEDKKAVEILRITNFQTPREWKLEERLKLCAYLLQNQALKAVGQGYENRKVSEVYATKIKGKDAVVFNGEMTDPKSSIRYFVKLVAVPDLNTDGGVMVFLMADATLSDVKAPEDLASKGLGLKVLHSLEFVQ